MKNNSYHFFLILVFILPMVLQMNPVEIDSISFNNLNSLSNTEKNTDDLDFNIRELQMEDLENLENIKNIEDMENIEEEENITQKKKKTLSAECAN